MSIWTKLRKAFFYSPYKNAAQARAKVGAGTILTKDFEVVQYQAGGERVRIGGQCLLSGKIVFESSKGAVSIGNGTFIGSGTRLISVREINIGNHVTIAWGVTVYDHNSHSLSHEERMRDQERQLQDWPTGNFIKNKNWAVVDAAPITIHDHAWIGFDAVILKGVTIGEGAIVAARSVVTKDVEAWTVVAGNPAQVVKRLK